jgi:hypothetical protein
MGSQHRKYKFHEMDGEEDGGNLPACYCGRGRRRLGRQYMTVRVKVQPAIFKRKLSLDLLLLLESLGLTTCPKKCRVVL